MRSRRCVNPRLTPPSSPGWATENTEGTEGNGEPLITGRVTARQEPRPTGSYGRSLCEAPAEPHLSPALRCLRSLLCNRFHLASVLKATPRSRIAKPSQTRCEHVPDRLQFYSGRVVTADRKL